MRSVERLSFRAPDSGSVLIITAWVLFLMAMLAAAVGTQSSRRLDAAGRIRDRLKAYGAARAGVARAVGVLGLETNAWQALTERWADSPGDFQTVPCGDAVYSVIRVGSGESSLVTNYGVLDEKARVDVNYADPEVLQGLLMTAGELDERAALGVVSNLVAARSVPGDGAKPPELRPFLCLQDVLAVAGIDEALFRRLEPHITVHGGGRRVNINTAGPVVLESLMRRGGAPPGAARDAVGSLTRKILQFREGGGMFMFSTGSGLLEALSKAVAVEVDEGALLQGLDSVITVGSDRFRIVAVGESRGGGRITRRIECVWNRTARTFEFWHED